MLRTSVSVILVALVTALALAAPTPEGNQLFPRGSNESKSISARHLVQGQQPCHR